MGVPKFYRWISERYPCLSEVVKEFQIPEFDNLYLDMNGIVHVCSHPEDDNPHFRITEEKIFSDIMHYLEFLFRMIKPRKVFFMAVDGVAPRAKMNQQRGRRFRSAREAEELERKAKDKGEVLPTEKRFDSNCITPGTPFMVRLQEQLKYFVVNMLTTDPLWQGVRVYLSGHETPGEGEHKIMDFIRTERSSPGYDPNTRHCLYGLDADLMMLGLASHEPHFALLREEVRFGGRKDKNKRPATPEETTFHLLHLQLFREYLDFEFSSLKDSLPFDYDLENIIDDWILMGFLVGNDFIPHLPNLHINHDALPLLWQTYMQVLPDCGGYINTGGKLNLERFEKYMTKLSEFDLNTFAEQAGDLKWLAGKKGIQSEAEREEMMAAARKLRKDIKRTENQFALLEQMSGTMDDFIELGTQIDSTPECSEADDLSDEDSQDDTLDDEFRHHKRHYYMTKMEYEKVTAEVLRDQAEGYVRGIQWILLYYYEGVPSWSWFYPHHYAPYMSDVKNFKDMNIVFEYGKAFKPFEQLMAVLPAASKELLPVPFQKLMVNDNSPVLDFYPLEFHTDLNGKQQDWEAVVLIPFIEEERLLAAMRTAESGLTPEERSRNIHGPCLLYEYQSEPLPPYPSSLPAVYPDIAVSHARLTKVPLEAFHLPSNQLVKGLLPGAQLDVFFPGFPTLRHIPHTAELRKEGVRVFQATSRGYNMMLQITSQDEPDVQRIANDYLGKEVFVNWPHLFEARVVSVSDGNYSFNLVEQPTQKKGKNQSNGNVQIVKEELDKNTNNIWKKEVATIAETYKSRLGVLVGQTLVLLRALPMTGRKYIFTPNGRITTEKQFGTRPVAFALQATVKNILVHDNSFCQFTTLQEYLPEGAAVFMLAWPHYGCQGEVIETDPVGGRVRINLTTFEEPNLSKIINTQQHHEVRYSQSYELAHRLGISSYLVTRLTGTVFCAVGNAELAREQQNPHRINIGLNLKFTKKGEEIPGYTKNIEGRWCYSDKTLQTLKEYMTKFPVLFSSLARAEAENKLTNENLYESELLPNCSYTLKDVQEYLKSLPCSNVKAMKTGADIISEGTIKALQDETNRVVEINKKRQKRVKMQVKPHLLFRPLPTTGALIPDASTQYELFDRVCNIRQGFPVPFGLRGTVIGIHPAEVEVNTMYEVLFDEDFQGGIEIRSSGSRGYRMPPSGLLNLTHGERKFGIRASTTPLQQHFQVNQQGNQLMYGLQQPSGRGAPMENNRSWERNQSVGNVRNYDNNYQARNKVDNQSRPAVSDSSNWRSGSVQAKNQSKAASDSYNWRNGPEQGTSQGSRRGPQGGNDSRSAAMDSRNQGSSDGVFNGSGGPQPTFVTPRVNQSGSKRLSQGEQQGAYGSGKGATVNNSSEFGDMWKQLESCQGTSLSEAAAALPKVTTPGENQNNNNTSTKIDLQSLFSGATQKVSIGEAILAKPKEAGNVLSANVNKQTTKDSQQKPAPLTKVVSNDEFAAMFKSLEALQMYKEEENKGKSDNAQEKVLTQPSQSESSDTTVLPSGGKKDYGRQVSIQELFAGAQQQKQQQDSEKDKNIPKTQHQQQPALQQQVPQQQAQVPWQQGFPPQTLLPQQQQTTQYQTRQPLLATPVHAGNRNPVMELMTYCQTQRLELPFYNNSTKNGQHFCEVTMFNGTRFQGSLCKTKEEAAESAASVALLQLKNPMYQPMGGAAMMRMQGMPGAGFISGILPQARQLASPNSAFLPVSTLPGPYQSQMAPTQYHGYQPQQRPYSGGQGHGYPYQGIRGNYRQQQPQQQQFYYQGGQNQMHQQQFQHHQQQHSQQLQQHKQQQQQPQQQQRPAQNVATVLQDEKPSKASISGTGDVKTCVVTPFVPLQVVKKQTPTKPRKENMTSESTATPRDNSVTMITKSNSEATKPQIRDIKNNTSVDNKSNFNMTVSVELDGKRTVSGLSGQGQPVQGQGEQRPRETSKTPEKQTQEGQAPSSGRKTKRRLAAKFANLQP